MQQAEGCYMCTLEEFQLSDVLNTALFHKYTESTGLKAYNNLDVLINSTPSRSLVLYRQQRVRDHRDEYLKNFYTVEQIPFKLYGLLDYYQFHKPVAHCHLQHIYSILEKHRHMRLKAYYKEIKRQLNMTVKDTTSSNFSSSKVSSSETTCKPQCSCVLCDVTGVNKIAKSESKALQDIYKDIEKAKDLDKEDYHTQRFMSKKQYDSSKAFETYVNTCENIQKRRLLLPFKKEKKQSEVAEQIVQPKFSAPVTYQTLHPLINQKLSLVSRYASIGDQQKPKQSQSAFRKLIRDKLNFNRKSQNKIIQFRSSAAYEPPVIKITSRKPSLNLRAKRVLDASPESLRLSNLKLSHRQTSESLRRTFKLRNDEIFLKRSRMMSLQTLKKSTKTVEIRNPKDPALARSVSIDWIYRRANKLQPKKIYERLRQL